MKRGVSLVFLDSNVPMYVLGEDHPNKEKARLLVEGLIDAGERIVTDAEVFQEILHRFWSIRQPERIDPAFEFLTRIVDDVYPVDMACVDLARGLLTGIQTLSARGAIHLGVMKLNGIRDIATFDQGFGSVPGIRILRDGRSDFRA